MDVIHISDISASGSKAKEDTWSITMMTDAITNEEAIFIKLGFSSRQVPRIKTVKIIAIRYEIKFTFTKNFSNFII